MEKSIKFLAIILSGLIAGTIFGISIGYNPQDLSAVAYVEQQQNAIRSLNVLMPVLGLIAAIFTLVYAFLIKNNTVNRNLLLTAIALFIISGLVTRFGNQTINAIVMTWDLENIPDTWTSLRDKWWTFHIVRTVTTGIGFALIVWVSINKNDKSRSV